MFSNGKMTTKDIFIVEALKLFAEKGYDNVSVSEIAEEVGCSAPALYKHFPSKQALFDAIIEMSNIGYEKHKNMLNLDFKAEGNSKDVYIDISDDKLVDIMKQVFLHTLHDEYPTLFRKVLIAEQFKNSDLAKMYDERYIENPMNQYATLFAMLIEEGTFVEADPKVLAMQYTFPTAVLVSMCDREPDKEAWALEYLEKHVRQFMQTHRK